MLNPKSNTAQIGDNNLCEMEEVNNYSEVFLSSLQAMGNSFMSAIPKILVAFIILLLGWLLAKLMARVVSKILVTMKFDVLAERVGAQKMLKAANVSVSARELISRFIYWILLLVVIITVADTLGWNAVSKEISKLLSFLPQLLAAIVFFVVGMYIATFVRDLIRGATSTLGISAGRVISTVVYYLLLLIVTLTALNQAGVDTAIITSNMLIIVGSIMAAAAISYGFASRDVLSNILAGFFSRRTVEVGQIVEIHGQRGKITAISSISIILQTSEKEKLIIPAKDLIQNPIKIIEG